MAKQTPITIKLGDESFHFRATTFNDLSRIEKAAFATPETHVEKAAGIIAALFERTYPEKAQAIRKLEFESNDPKGLITAMNDVLRFAGFIGEDATASIDAAPQQTEAVTEARRQIHAHVIEVASQTQAEAIEVASQTLGGA